MKKIFILHGWSYNTEKWQPFLQYLQKEKFLPVLLKVPGLTAAIDRVWTLDDYVEWLYNQIAKDKQPIILLGHSNGGRIALAFASKYPEKVKQLILIDSAGIYHNELPIRLKRTLFRNIAKVGKKLTSSNMLKQLLYKFVREQDYNQASLILKQTMRNLITVDLRRQLYKITTPTLIIWGEEDKITPLSDGKIIHALIKKSRLSVIKDGNHSPHFKYPEIVSQKVSQAIETN